MSFSTQKIGSLVFSLIFLFFLFGNLYSQIDFLNTKDLSGIEMDKISDAELMKIYHQSLAAGYTEDDLLAMVKEKGLPPSDVNLLRIRINSLKSTQNRTNTDLSEKLKKDAKTSRYDVTGKNLPVLEYNTDKDLFGNELFTTSSLTFEPNLRIPPPLNYILGPDDELNISIFGLSETRYNAKIDESGEIYIQNVGPILISGLTLEQAYEKIKNKLASTIYSAIRTGQTKVQVTLGKIRSIRVTVIGQAKRPGTYTVSSLTTLYNLLYLCGGPTEMGSYRNIETIRGNEKRTADLYNFLVFGNQKDNILLQEGDVIRIPYYKNRITLSGNVKRQGQYEMQGDETFKDLLEYSGGFLDNAYRGEVSVERLMDSVRKIIDLKANSFSSFKIKGSDKYYVRRLQDEFSNRLSVTGSVQRPGSYELTPGITIRELINKAGGLTSDAYRSRALVYRYLPNKTPAIQSVNLDSVFLYDQNIFLQNNDSVVINSLFFFKDNQLITIKGNVRNPIQITWREGMTLKDALFSAGGIIESGDSTNIEVSRRIVDPAVESKNYKESEIFKINLNNFSASDIRLQPFDIIVIKEKPGYSTQRSVIVSGAVMSPGTYVLETSGSKITDIIRRTGGFKASADSSSLAIRREKGKSLTNEERERVFQKILVTNEDSLFTQNALQAELNQSYDLIPVDLKHILDQPDSPENLQLEDGDILTIERTANLVKVSGEVYFPTIVAYKDGKNLKYFVRQAGNFTPKARKSGALVINPNGKVASVKHFLFFRSYPSVSPRSEIFVPAKEKSNHSKLGATEWAVIVSALGILSNVVINIAK